MLDGPKLPDRATAAEVRRWRAEVEAWVKAENARVANQRLAWERAHTKMGLERVMRLMMDRAWALLDAGEAERADELLNFLPEKVARKLLTDFFGE